MHCLFDSLHAHLNDPATWTVYTYTSVWFDVWGWCVICCKHNL